LCKDADAAGVIAADYVIRMVPSIGSGTFPVGLDG
jgi:hypothetical protein